MAASFSRTCFITALASVTLAFTASRTSLSMTAAFSFNFLAVSRNFWQASAEIMSSHFTAFSSANSNNSSSSKAGKSFCLIFSMISLAFVIPLATISLKTLSTSAAFTLIFSARSLSFEHRSAGRASSHLKFFAMAASFSRTCFITALASVTLAFTASRTSLSMTAAFSFNFVAVSRNFWQVSAEIMSSHFTAFSSANSNNTSSSKAGKSFCLIFSMISLTFVMPLATISLNTLSTSAALTLTFSASSLTLAHTSAGRASSHLKFLAISTSFCRTRFAISLASVIFSFTTCLTS